MPRRSGAATPWAERSPLQLTQSRPELVHSLTLLASADLGPESTPSTCRDSPQPQPPRTQAARPEVVRRPFAGHRLLVADRLKYKPLVRRAGVLGGACLPDQRPRRPDRRLLEHQGLTALHACGSIRAKSTHSNANRSKVSGDLRALGISATASAGRLDLPRSPALDGRTGTRQPTNTALYTSIS